jgi:Tfp pilus assembly protein PilP
MTISMKTAMKQTTGILAVAIMMTAGVCAPKAAAQNTDAIDNARSVAKSLQQKQTNDSNAALDAAGVPAPSAKPAPGAPAPAVKPVVLPSSSKPAAQATQAQAPAVKPAAAPSKPATSASAKPAVKTATAKPAVKVVAKAAAPAAKPAAKPAVKEAAKVAAKEKDTKAAVVAAPMPPAQSAAGIKPVDAPADPKADDKKWAMDGKRDPFFSPVVQAQGSGCSTGKKCLEIGQINVRGVVKSENGFIAVVTNNLNKAYFLRENDPVFNGYVVRITGDSVVFQETVQDKLGKTSTREVVKKIYTPAV